MSYNFSEEQEKQINRENLKAVWKYYLIAFVGLGLIWLAQKVTGTLSTVLTAVGAVVFFAGVFITLYWDRKRKKELLAEDEKEPASRK